jgi:hypothetical protein
MEIYIGSITDPLNRDKRRPSKPDSGKPRIERRKAKYDRRRSVREGIIVTLSIKNDRRSGNDRRKGSP